MNTYTKSNMPFIFRLAEEFLPAVENREEDIQPIGNREFYGIMSMIIAALIVLKIIFN